MHIAGRERRGKRLGIHPGQHEDSAVTGVLDDRRNEAIRIEGELEVGALRRHAAAAT
jgi:hypothetical protein